MVKPGYTWCPDEEQYIVNSIERNFISLQEEKSPNGDKSLREKVM
jgi:hypothetical protein